MKRWVSVVVFSIGLPVGSSLSGLVGGCIVGEGHCDRASYETIPEGLYAITDGGDLGLTGSILVEPERVTIEATSAEGNPFLAVYDRTEHD